MKRYRVAEIITLLLVLLFVYTATSKFLDYDRFVFQMKLAPLPLMKFFAGFLGWLVPTIELILSAGLCVGFFVPKVLRLSLKASLYLMLSFEIYIVLMLLSGYSLPCTCGGIISKMSWKGHVLFNGIVIILNTAALKFTKAQLYLKDNYKDFSRV